MYQPTVNLPCIQPNMEDRLRDLWLNGRGVTDDGSLLQCALAASMVKCKACTPLKLELHRLHHKLLHSRRGFQHLVLVGVCVKQYSGYHCLLQSLLRFRLGCHNPWAWPCNPQAA